MNSNIGGYRSCD